MGQFQTAEVGQFQSGGSIRPEHGYRRRLFAEDAVQGFAFIDLCRKTFDVALMNPPFGDATPSGKTYIDEHYPSSRQDLFATFVDRAVTDQVPHGFVGVLSTEAGFFRRTLEPFRRDVLLARSTMSVMAHLGGCCVPRFSATGFSRSRPGGWSVLPGIASPVSVAEMVAQTA